MAAWTLIVPLKNGRVRKYRSTSERAVLRRLADHNALVDALGTGSQYLTAYVRDPNGREYYKTSA